MRFLITGGNGFIGSNLAITLKKRIKKSEVFLLDINFDKKTLFERDIKLINSNLLELNHNELPEVDVVIHAAALLGVDFVNKNPISVILQNIGSFLPLKKYLYNPNIKFIFFSTSEVYGDGYNRRTNKFFENDSEKPLILPDLKLNRSSYALSKIIGEFLTSRSQNYINLRPHNIYGPEMGNKHVIPNLINKFHSATKTKSIEIFNPDHIRSFCYISDAIDQILYLIEKNSCGDYNIGNPNEPVSINFLADLIMKKMGLNVKFKVRKENLNSPAYRKPIIKFPEINFTSLSDGLDHMIKSYKK